MWGGITVAIGSLLAVVAGYGIGRLIPEAWLRRWVGPVLWDRAREQASDRALWWIVVARPLPVLAELSALLAGVWRLPPMRALAHATAASAVIGALYAASAWLGQRELGMPVLLIAMSTLPAATWVAHRLVLRRLLRMD